MFAGSTTKHLVICLSLLTLRVKPGLTCVTLNVLLGWIGWLITTTTCFPLGRFWSELLFSNVISSPSEIGIWTGCGTTLKFSNRIQHCASSVYCLNIHVLVVICWKELYILCNVDKSLALWKISFLVEPLDL